MLRSPRDIRELDHNLRVLTLARGVHDLRTLDNNGDSMFSVVSRDVWFVLLLFREDLDLRPFLPRDTDDRWNSGLGLPLGVLADLQIYTTNADPRIMGKGHSPFCQYARDRGVMHDDFLMTLQEIMRRSDVDWCSNCGGYAIRRLTDEQISYYRVAHRLFGVDQGLSRELEWHGQQEADLAGARSALDESSQWLHGDHERWSTGDTWRVQDVVRELKDRADRLARYRRDGWPDGGSIIQLKPNR